MAELSDNVRWLVTNLIDQDQRICVELQRRGEEYTAAGRPRDGSLQRDARLLVEDVVRQHNDMWPEASIGFTPEELPTPRKPCRRFPRLRLPRTARAGRRRLRHRRNQ